MKRLFLMSIAVGLIIVFGCLQAGAVDVKFSGQYTYEGWYENKRTVSEAGSSTGFQDHTLLLKTQFKIAEGLNLYTRARILDKIWGDGAVGAGSDTRDRLYDTSRLQRENIEFDMAYLSANIGPGTLIAGNISPPMFGTALMDDDYPAAMVTYGGLIGSIYHEIGYVKYRENEVSKLGGTSFGAGSDVDSTRFKYVIIYPKPRWIFGMEAEYHTDQTNRPGPWGYTVKYFGFDPWVKVNYGPLYIEAEGYILHGEVKFDAPPIPLNDISLRGYDFFAKARYTLGPAYAGLTMLYVTGDDDTTPDKQENGPLSGRELKMALILVNPDRDKWLGALGAGGNAQTLGDSYRTGQINGGVTNIQMYQAFVGIHPVEDLDIRFTYSTAKLEKKPSAYLDDGLGTELDITATYKIYDNLSYMVGFGYLWAGDAWKGANAAGQVSNDWLIMHKMTLNF